MEIGEHMSQLTRNEITMNSLEAQPGLLKHPTLQTVLGHRHKQPSPLLKLVSASSLYPLATLQDLHSSMHLLHHQEDHDSSEGNISYTGREGWASVEGGWKVAHKRRRSGSQSSEGGEGQQTHFAIAHSGLTS